MFAEARVHCILVVQSFQISGYGYSMQPVRWYLLTESVCFRIQFLERRIIIRIDNCERKCHLLCKPDHICPSIRIPYLLKIPSHNPANIIRTDHADGYFSLRKLVYITHERLEVIRSQSIPGIGDAVLHPFCYKIYCQHGMSIIMSSGRLKDVFVSTEPETSVDKSRSILASSRFTSSSRESDRASKRSCS